MQSSKVSTLYAIPFLPLIILQANPIFFVSPSLPQAKDVHNFLNAKNRSRAYPLFDKVYQIAWEGVPVEKLTEGL